MSLRESPDLPAMVDLEGIEPSTSCVQSRCSPSVSYRPKVILHGLEPRLPP